MRPSQLSSRRRGLLGVIALTVVFAFGCGGSSSMQKEFAELLEAKDWPEIKARAELAREAGATGAWLDHAEGLALLHENADKAAEPLFEKAVAVDPSLAPSIGAAYHALALADHEAGWNDRAKRRMYFAILHDDTLDPGPLLDATADYFYRFVKDYEGAHPLYYRLYKERPEPTTKHREWVYRYGHCLERIGDKDGAMAVYEEFVEIFPRDMQIMRFVQWRYMTGLIEWAEEAMARAQPDEAVRLLDKALGTGWHMDLQQRARYLRGQIHEEKGELDAAREWYDKILADGNRFGGDIVKQAQARLDALGEMGVH